MPRPSEKSVLEIREELVRLGCSEDIKATPVKGNVELTYNDDVFFTSPYKLLPLLKQTKSVASPAALWETIRKRGHQHRDQFQQSLLLSLFLLLALLIFLKILFI